jgi:hypothetical protein
MKPLTAAVVVWKDRIAPVFDAASEWMELTFLEGRWVEAGVYSFQSSDPEEMIQEVLDRHPDRLICGALPFRYERLLLSRGCGVSAFIRGPVHEVIRAMEESRLEDPLFRMPGCRRGRRGRCFGQR